MKTNNFILLLLGVWSVSAIISFQIEESDLTIFFNTDSTLIYELNQATKMDLVAYHFITSLERDYVIQKTFFQDPY